MSLSSKHSDEDDSLQMDLLLNYELCEEIGRGGSAIVYSAKCKRGRLRNRVVALKKINIPANPKAVIPIAHLKSSTKLHQSLFHPSVVSLLSVFSTHYAQFHVLEHCPHGTLMSRVKRPPLHRLSEPELRGVLKGLVDGLLYLRKELVIHRDIKPSNILISTDWRVKIADFGLAVRVESESSTVVDSCGTPHYKSPQLVAEQPYGFETDLWSLGALIVTCLTGVHPFYAASVAKMNSKITRAEYALPSSLSYEVRDLVAGLLQIDRNKRTPLHHILSHPFFSSSLPFIPLHFNIPHLTLTQATPSQSNIRQAVPPALMPSNPRYPQHLSKVATPPTFTSDPKDFGLPTRTSSVRKPIQSRRNFLSDTWQPRQTPLITLPYRRIVSVPTSASDSTSKSSFLALKREDIKARRTTPNSNNPESVCLASQSAKSSSLVPDVGFRTPALTTDSDSDPPSAAPGSGSGSDSDSELESRSRSRSRSALRLGSRLLLLEPKAQERRKLNPLLTLDMAKQAVMDLENLSELAAELSSMKATKLLVPPSPSSLSSSVGASSLVVPIKQASEDLRNSDDAKSAFEAGFTSTRSLKSYQDEPGQSFKRVSSSRPAEIRDNAASSSSRAQPSSSLPGRFPPQMQDARSPVQLASDRVPGGLCKLFPALPARPSLEISGKPIRLNTEYLVCQTQKVLKGQVTVLPSKSLLVDLREGERRKGRKGDEVLVVSPDGETIKVYSAPHLSTPCCLAEPSAEYTFDLLPREYWNRYSDAGKVVSQLKQRIPRFVLYRPEAQCTLMANEPYGDVEIILPPPERKYDSQMPQKYGSGSHSSSMPTDYVTRLKLRLRQDRRMLEISKYNCFRTVQFPLSGTAVPATLTGERTNPGGVTVTSKKVVPVVRAGYDLELVDEGTGWTLDESETAGVKIVKEFLVTCKAVQGADQADLSQGVHNSGVGGTEVHALTGQRRITPTEEDEDAGERQTCATAGSSVAVSSATGTTTTNTTSSVLSQLHVLSRAGPTKSRKRRTSSLESGSSGATPTWSLLGS